MSVGIIIKADVRQVRKALKQLSKVGGNLRQPFGQIGLFIRRDAMLKLRSRPSDWGPRTGRLGKSLAMRVTDTSVTVGSNLVYAAIQQLGGTVLPKKKFLAIPIPAQLRRRGAWPRDFPPETLKYVPNAEIKIGSHSWIGPALVRASDQEIESSFDGAGLKSAEPKTKKRRVGRQGEILFALVKQVKIKGRPYLTFGKEAVGFSLEQIRREYRRAVGGS